MERVWIGHQLRCIGEHSIADHRTHQELDVCFLWSTLQVCAPDDAGALLAVGDSPADATLDAADLAAHAVVCAVILNLDEVLTRP